MQNNKKFFIKWYSSKTYHPSEDTVRILINDIRYQLLKTAQKRKTEFRNFASTLSVVLASKEETVFFLLETVRLLQNQIIFGG